MTELTMLGFVLVGIITARLVYKSRFQKCPACGKFALSDGDLYRFSCIDQKTGRHYPEAYIEYKCRACGSRHIKNFADKWIEKDAEDA